MYYVGFFGYCVYVCFYLVMLFGLFFRIMLVVSNLVWMLFVWVKLWVVLVVWCFLMCVFILVVFRLLVDILFCKNVCGFWFSRFSIFVSVVSWLVSLGECVLLILFVSLNSIDMVIGVLKLLFMVLRKCLLCDLF